MGPSSGISKPIESAEEAPNELTSRSSSHGRKKRSPNLRANPASFSLDFIFQAVLSPARAHSSNELPTLWIHGTLERWPEYQNPQGCLLLNYLIKNDNLIINFFLYQSISALKLCESRHSD